MSFFPTDRYSDLLNFRFIIFEKYFPFLKVWLNKSRFVLGLVFIHENAKILSDHDFIHGFPFIEAWDSGF